MVITRNLRGGKRRRRRRRKTQHRRRRRRRGGRRPRTRGALKSRLRSYRRRVRSSKCRGKGPAVCRGAAACKYASGRRRSFCRKSRNTRRHRR